MIVFWSKVSTAQEVGFLLFFRDSFNVLVAKICKELLRMQHKMDEILPLIYSIEIRDSYTQGHSEHVAYYARELASVMGLSRRECDDIYIAGLLHDIGKIGIPDTVLLKPGKLEREEYELIKFHSVLSAEIVQKLQHFSYLQKIVKHHHEDFNGQGYPDGLKAEEIPLLSRILSIVDVFDALTTKRIYRAEARFDTTLEIMEKMQAEGKFDPDVYAAFLPFIKKHGVYKHKITNSVALKGLEQKRNNFFYKDTLTQLLNRTAFLGLLRKIHDYQYKVSLILCNINQFKLYNQKYGLRKGDLVLKKIAESMQDELRGITHIKEPEVQDLFLFRVGSDKFLLLYIGAKYAFFSYKLDQIFKTIKASTELEIRYDFLVKGHVIGKNFEEEIGYLL